MPAFALCASAGLAGARQSIRERRRTSDAIDRREQGRQAQVNEIDAGNTEDDIAIRHDAFAQERVEDIEKACVFAGLEERGRGSPPGGVLFPSSMNE